MASRAVERVGRWGIALVVVGLAGCGGGPVAPDATDSPTPEPTVAPTSQEPTPADPEAGWTVSEDYAWPIQPGCCGMADVGPVSPSASAHWPGWGDDTATWPPDGVYAVELLRTADAPSRLQLTVRRWVRCSDLPDNPCAPDPAPDPATGEDVRITPDPGSRLQRTVLVQDVSVVLLPIQTGAETTVALVGDPGALSDLLLSGLDPAYRQWVSTPRQSGTSVEDIRQELLDHSTDPAFPFGLDYCESGEACGPIAYRGPYATSLLAEPSWVEPSNGLYGWRPIALEIHDGKPVLHLWAGQIAG